MPHANRTLFLEMLDLGISKAVKTSLRRNLMRRYDFRSGPLSLCQRHGSVSELRLLNGVVLQRYL